jgi:hypothetical protein
MYVTARNYRGVVWVRYVMEMQMSGVFHVCHGTTVAAGLSLNCRCFSISVTEYRRLVWVRSVIEQQMSV